MVHSINFGSDEIKKPFIPKDERVFFRGTTLIAKFVERFLFNKPASLFAITGEPGTTYCYFSCSTPRLHSAAITEQGFQRITLLL